VIGIGISFPSGRYHATPWGRHVNEAAPEWPPSPWRLLRGLIAVWKRKYPDLSADLVEFTLRQLAIPPQFMLPPASTGHTRHYMPWFKKGPDDKTLVFDTFVAVPKDAKIQVLWPEAELDAEQHELLITLLRGLNFLGRAEAWCQADLLLGQPATINCQPLNGQSMQEGHEIVRILCVDPDTAFDDDHVVTIEQVSHGRGKNKVTKERRTSPYDPAWNLCIETLKMHKEKWSDPPGSQWIRYLRPKDCFRVQPKRVRTRTQQQRFQIARYALDSTVLPLATETLPIAEQARRALMGIYGRLIPEADGSKGRSPTFSGKDSEGRKRLDPHLHAFYLPTDEDGDGRLDHLTVYAREGYNPDELKALDRLTRLHSAERDASGHVLRLVLLGIGQSNDYRPGPLAESRVWVSATPFIAPRHPKRKGEEAIFWRPRTQEELDRARQNNRQIKQHVLADPAGWLAWALHQELLRWINRQSDMAELDPGLITITPLVNKNGVFQLANRWRPIQFKRFRQKRNDDGGRRLSGAFRIEFPHPVPGPIALGYSSHFGLGQFDPKILYEVHTNYS